MSLPVLNGATLKRPNGHTRTRERVERVVERGDGSEVTYARGYRYVWSLTWTRLRAAELAAIEVASAGSGPVAFVDVDGISGTVRVAEDLGIVAVAGTEPVRYDATLTLREPLVRRA